MAPDVENLLAYTLEKMPELLCFVSTMSGRGRIAHQTTLLGSKFEGDSRV